MVVNLQQLSFIPQGMEQAILGPLDIQLVRGEWLTVFGGNGSGKSTLAQLLCGWLPDLLCGSLQGRGEVLGVALEQDTLVHLAAARQLVQQSPLLQLSGCAFSVEQEIAFGPENLGLAEEEIHQRVNEALCWAECQHLRQRHPATLSGGEAQRVVIASALAMRPQLLLLDEAFSRLTPGATLRLLHQLKRYSQEYLCSLVLFERSLFPLAALSDKLILLESGQILASGTLQQVFNTALDTINAPDAWRALGHLVKAGRWPTAIPHDDDALLQAVKALYASAP